MKVSELKQYLSQIEAIRFRLPDGTYIASHFHITEVGLITKHFIDCGGTERRETIANFQLWQADDYHHRLAPQKFLYILELSRNILGSEDLQIEVEYQQNTIGKYGLEFDGADFLLAYKHTACLASDVCGRPQKKKISLQELANESACCTPGGGCC